MEVVGTIELYLLVTKNIDKNDNVFLTGGTNSYNFPSSSKPLKKANYQDSMLPENIASLHMFLPKEFNY